MKISREIQENEGRAAFLYMTKNQADRVAPHLRGSFSLFWGDP